MSERVIGHLDLDAFYCQVEVKRDQRLHNMPVGVVQYNPYGDLATHTPSDDRLFNDSNGSLIAVSYEARAFGVKRNMRAKEARQVCPNLQLVQVPTAHGKADLTLYRDSSKQVVEILSRVSVCERASIDECYLDITAEALRRLEACAGTPALPANVHEVHVCGQEAGGAEAWWLRSAGEWGPSEQLLACGAAAMSDLRAAVRDELGYSCSAGIAHCKLLAKLASGMHKPSQQTLVPLAAVPRLLHDLPIPKLRQLGGKFGEDIMRQLAIKTVGELVAVPKSRLQAIFGDQDGQWLSDLSHGVDHDEVKQRTLPKSISCSKTFQGNSALRKLPDVLRWLKELGRELEERVAVDRAENAREPKLLTVQAGNISRSMALRRPTTAVIAEDAHAMVKRWAVENPGWSITSMGVGVSAFVAAPTGMSTMTRFLKPAASPLTALPQHSPPSQHGPPLPSGADSVTLHNLLDTAPVTCEEPATCDASVHAHPYGQILPAANREDEGESSGLRENKAETHIQGIQTGSIPRQDPLAEADTSDLQQRPPSGADSNCQQAEHVIIQESSSLADVASRSARCAEEGEAGAAAPAAMPWDEGNIDPQVLAALPWDIQQEMQLAMTKARAGPPGKAASGPHGISGQKRKNMQQVGRHSSMRKHTLQDNGSIHRFLKKK